MLPTNTHILFPEFEYHEPTTLRETLALLAQYGDDARVMAGGTDLLVQMKMERRQPSHVIALQHVAELNHVTQNDGIEIGARVTLRALYNSPFVTQSYTALAEASNGFSTVQIMYMATLGGNLCNASPAADSAPCLLVFDAMLTLESTAGARTLPLSEFFLAPGKTVMRPDELLTQIHLPTPAPNTGSAFIKISRVVADISQVCVAIKLVRSGNLLRDARIALGSVAPTPFRAIQTAAALIGQPFTPERAAQAGVMAANEIKPIGDVRATREYRQQVASVIVRDALIRAWERAQ